MCQPPRRLLVTLNPGQDDETVVEAEIIPDGERTRLVLEERGLPLNGAAGHGAGWQAHVEDLGAHLAGRPRTGVPAGPNWVRSTTTVSGDYRSAVSQRPSSRLRKLPPIGIRYCPTMPSEFMPSGPSSAVIADGWVT